MNDENAGCFTEEAARDRIRERWGITDKDTMKAKREAEEAVKPLSNIERLSGIERKLDGIKAKLDRLIEQRQSENEQLKHIKLSNLSKREHVNKSG